MSDPTLTSIDPALDAVGAEAVKPDKPRGLLGDAWQDLRRKPTFWIAAILILLFVVMAVVPWIFTSADPTYGDLGRSRVGPSANGWFGFDIQGRDVYARAIYGARASIIVSLSATLG